MLGRSKRPSDNNSGGGSKWFGSKLSSLSFRAARARLIRVFLTIGRHVRQSRILYLTTRQVMWPIALHWKHVTHFWRCINNDDDPPGRSHRSPATQTEGTLSPCTMFAISSSSTSFPPLPLRFFDAAFSLIGPTARKSLAEWGRFFGEVFFLGSKGSWWTRGKDPKHSIDRSCATSLRGLALSWLISKPS